MEQHIITATKPYRWTDKQTWKKIIPFGHYAYFMQGT